MYDNEESCKEAIFFLKQEVDVQQIFTHKIRIRSHSRVAQQLNVKIKCARSYTFTRNEIQFVE